MNNMLILILFAVICFAVVALAAALFHKDALFTIAIGAVIGANVYNIGSFPIQVGKLVFGIDGVVYCVFLFCLLVMYIDYGKKSANLNLYTALFSIFFTALLSFFGNYFLNQGWSSSQIWATASYFFSIVATYVTVVLMFKLYDFMIKRKANKVVTFGLCILVANLVNSIIYFGLTFLTSGSLGENFIYSLLGSAITKFVTTIFYTILFVLYEKFWNKNKEANLNNTDNSNNENKK